MTVESIAAETCVFAIAPNGTEHTVVLRVGVPTLQANGGWGSSVFLGALDSHPSTICGDDSWQAIQLAMRFIAIRVAHFGDNGWLFFWEPGGAAFSPPELLRWGAL